MKAKSKLGTAAACLLLMIVCTPEGPRAVSPQPVTLEAATVPAAMVAAAAQANGGNTRLRLEILPETPRPGSPFGDSKAATSLPYVQEDSAETVRVAKQFSHYEPASVSLPQVDLGHPVKLDVVPVELSTADPLIHPEPAPSMPLDETHFSTGRLVSTARLAKRLFAVAKLPGVSRPAFQQPGGTYESSVSARSNIGALGVANDGIFPASSSGLHHYTGKPISLDLRDVDIRDFFRLIHQISGLNVVVDADVTGRITMVMNAVPWDQALDIVLQDNGLSTQFEGNVLRIARIKTLGDEAKAEADARAARLEAEPLCTVLRRLQYARAADQQPVQVSAIAGAAGGGAPTQVVTPGVATILNGLKGVFSPDGKAIADPRDNAVVITDHPSQIPIIEAVIDKLDKRAKQVSIQVRVVLASADFTRTLSAVLSGAFSSPMGHTNGAGGTGQGITAVAPLSSPLPGLSALTQPASVAASGFGAFAITTQSAKYAINAAITAAETRDQARTISRPTIVTQDNVMGEVQQGVEVPVQTSINNTIAVQYVNATLQLTVTPQVTSDNKVFLNVYVQNASVGTLSTFAGPSINTQQATTQVIVPDGGTVVFGGITVTTRSRSATGVPVLGSIPVFGNLFKSSSVNDQNQELLFFVSPTVLPS